jgi:hypothetical protein
MIDPTPTHPFYEELTQKKMRATIQNTPHPDCPACKAGRMHTEAEWERYHPASRTGTVDGKFFGRTA